VVAPLAPSFLLLGLLCGSLRVVVIEAHLHDLPQALSILRNIFRLCLLQLRSVRDGSCASIGLESRIGCLVLIALISLLPSRHILYGLLAKRKVDLGHLNLDLVKYLRAEVLGQKNSTAIAPMASSSVIRIKVGKKDLIGNLLRL